MISYSIKRIEKKDKKVQKELREYIEKEILLTDHTSMGMIEVGENHLSWLNGTKENKEP